MRWFLKSVLEAIVCCMLQRSRSLSGALDLDPNILATARLASFGISTIPALWSACMVPMRSVSPSLMN